MIILEGYNPDYDRAMAEADAEEDAVGTRLLADLTAEADAYLTRAGAC